MKRSKIIGIIGTVVLHVAVLVFLFLYVLVLPEKQEEGGVPVMLGDSDMGQGDADPYTLTEVDLLPQPRTFFASEKRRTSARTATKRKAGREGGSNGRASETERKDRS